MGGVRLNIYVMPIRVSLLRQAFTVGRVSAPEA